MTTSRRLLLGGSLAAMATGLAACGDDGTTVKSSASAAPGASSTPGAASSAAQPAPAKVTIQIDGAAVPYYAPLYVAKENGHFAKQNLEVEFIYADASTLLKNVAAGNVQLGFPNGDAVISAAANGVPVKVIHSTYQQGIGAVLSLKETGINSAADLKGKTVAVTSLGSPNYVQLQVMGAQNGFDIKKDVTVKVVGTAAIVDALKNKEVQAIVFSRLRYYALTSAGLQVNQLLTDDFLPSYGNVLVTSDTFLKSSPGVGQRFVTAFDEALTWIINGHAKEAVTMAISKYSPDFKGQEDSITKIVEEVFVKDLWQSANTRTNGLGYADMARWQKAIDIQKQYGLITGDIKADTIVMQPKSL